MKYIIKIAVSSLLLLWVGGVASAQYSFKISLRISNCQGLEGRITEQAYPQIAQSYNASMFTTYEECETVRNAINKSFKSSVCTISISVTPCVGSGSAGTSGSTGSIYKGQTSFYSANPTNEIKDWAKDNDEFFKIIGGVDTSIPAQTVQTGDEGYDKMIQKDIEDLNKSIPEKKEEGVQQTDDRPGFDDGFFVGRTFRSLGSDWSSPDFNQPPKISDVQSIPIEETHVNYTPEANDYTGGDDGHESFGKKAISYVSEKLENHEGLKQAWDIATETCTTMTETVIESTSATAKKVVGVVSTVGSVLNFKKFMTNYTTDLTNEVFSGIKTSVRTGRPPRKVISDELRDRPKKEARNMIIKGGAKAGYKDLWSGRVL